MITFYHTNIRGDNMKMMVKLMLLLGGSGLLGMLYLKKHPEKIQMMKDLGKEASRKMYNQLDTE